MPKRHKGGRKGARERVYDIFLKKKKKKKNKKPNPNIRLIRKRLNVFLLGSVTGQEYPLTTPSHCSRGPTQCTTARKKNRRHRLTIKKMKLLPDDHTIAYIKIPSHTTRSNQFSKTTGYRSIYKNQEYFSLVH